MIAINVLILVLFVLEHGNQVCNAADVTGTKSISQFLRRRRTNSNAMKYDEEAPLNAKADSEDSNMRIPVAEPKKRLFFGLRQPQVSQPNLVRIKSNERLPTAQNGYLDYFISSAFSGINKALDAIEGLEKEYEEQMKQEEMKQVEPLPPMQRDLFVSKLLAASLKNFEDDEEDEERDDNESGNSSVSSQTLPEKDNVMASGITVDEDYDLEFHCSNEPYDRCNSLFDLKDLSEIATENEISASPVMLSSPSPIASDVHQETTIAEVVNEPHIETLDTNPPISNIDPVDDSLSENLIADCSAADLAPVEAVKSDFIVLSDSESESWEKVEINMVENVTLMALNSDIVQLLNDLGHRKTVVDFLAVIFVKLAKKLFLRPTPVSKSPARDLDTLKKSISTSSISKYDSSEDFIHLSDQDHLPRKGLNGHTFLDSETAQKVLFYQNIDTETDDWEFIPLSSENFAEAKEFIAAFEENDYRVIKNDVPRLPRNYYNFYAERRGREVMESDIEELQENVKSLLAFIMAFEAKAEEVSCVDAVSYSVLSSDQKISYMQGFHQIVAYFAINFDLTFAGMIAYRFFQVYMLEIIKADNVNMIQAFNRIDARAVKIIRAYLGDQIGAIVFNFEALLGILERYRFSDISASICYFNSATNLTDLDRLVQLLLTIPQSQAHKSISLLAATNMLYSMLILDKIFCDELGSTEWKQLKDNINDLRTPKLNRTSALDNLVSKFMGQLLLHMGHKMAHQGKEFDEFLGVAQSLIPYLQQFD